MPTRGCIANEEEKQGNDPVASGEMTEREIDFQPGLLDLVGFDRKLVQFVII
jgi:hypothetical protein